MLFNSSAFLVFFPIVVLLYFVIPFRFRNYWLLLASIVFYACWNVKYLVLLFFSIAATYLSALILPGVKENKLRKGILIACLLLNLSILFFFKYFNFASSQVVRFGDLFGIVIPNLTHGFLLPVGISFYTFQALSYSIDVYKGRISPEKNILKYALFVSFFPQLVAGPIERSEHLLPQFDELHYFDTTRVKHGLELMLWGFFEKLVIADRVAIFVNQVYNHYEGYAFWEIFFASIGFAIQIYCDFGGYSHIAIGAAQVLGFELCDNFKQPYFALSIKDFWRRWHISLSSWFRDYLYIPMGGNREGKVRYYLNIIITFVVSGLWHGASWNYVIWGGIHGIYQVLGNILAPVKDRILTALKVNRTSDTFRLTEIAITFLLTVFAWIFFRASSGYEAIMIIKQMFSSYNPWVLFDMSLYECGLSRRNVMILVASVLLLLGVDILHEKGIRLRMWIDRQNQIARLTMYYVALMIVLFFGVYGPSFDAGKFIYFTF